MSAATATPRQSKSINFGNLTRIEVNIENLEGKNYVLREATGAAAAQYKNDVLKKSKFGPDGKPQAFDGVADVEPLLVSLCLFELKSDGTAMDSPVPVNVIKRWPARVVAQLFSEAKRISGMEDDDTLPGLEKQLEDLQQKIQERQAAEEQAKN
jgi:hypothetical protein